jgi:hypothetical protein
LCADPVIALVPEGSTASGATGLEFRVDLTKAGSYLAQSEEVPSGAIKLGDALGGGCNVAFATCQHANAISFLSFLVLNPGIGASDSEIRIFGADFLALQQVVLLPRVGVGGRGYAAHGRFAFFSRDGTSRFVLASVDASAGLIAPAVIVAY